MQAVRTGSLTLSETGAAQFSVSDTGALVYVPGVTAPETSDLAGMGEPERHGDAHEGLPTGPYGGPRLSPDGQRVSLVITELEGRSIHDLARGGLCQWRLEIWPTFTPDGKQITVTEPSGFVSMSIERWSDRSLRD